jgi:serine/threonine protein kinase
MLSTEVNLSLDRVIYKEHKQLTSFPLDLKPENLLYLTKDPESDLVLADFGIAKMLDRKDEVLTTMAGSFGYAAPEVMLKRGHGKPVDMWSMGVITYTLLCGYSPFRSENLQDLIDECSNAQVVFHERYWKDVSDDAKDFIMQLLQPEPDKRSNSEVSPSPKLRPVEPVLTTWIGSPSPPLAQRRKRNRPQLAARNQGLHGQGQTQAWYRTCQACEPYRSSQDPGG